MGEAKDQSLCCFLFISNLHFYSPLCSSQDVKSQLAEAEKKLKNSFHLAVGRTIVIRGQPLYPSPTVQRPILLRAVCTLGQLLATTTLHFDIRENVHLLQQKGSERERERTSGSLLLLLLALVCVCTVDAPLPTDRGNAEAWLCKTCMSCSVLLQ